MLAPQNSNSPVAATATMDHRHCIDFCLPLHRRSIQPIILSAHYFEVIKKKNFTLPNFYILLSLSLSTSIFHGTLLVCGCGLLWIYLFIYFFWQISTFSSSSFVVKSMAKKNHEIFVIRFSFSPFFCMQILLDFWFLGILLFGFNFGFVLVDI